MPRFSAAASNATSMGSPIPSTSALCSSLCSLCSSSALLHNTPSVSSSSDNVSAFASVLRSSIPASVSTETTTILFSVSVPVLSVQITFVAPRVSTAERRLIRALLRAILHIPLARARVAMIGNPSGIAATARAIDVSIIR